MLRNSLTCFFQTQTVEVTSPNVEVNYANLASFLKRITPSVMEMLDEVHDSNAFEGYHPSSSDEPTARVQMLSSFYTLGDTNVNVNSKLFLSSKEELPCKS